MRTVQRRQPEYRHEEPGRCSLLFLLTLALTACPSTGPTPLAISEVLVEGDPSTTTFNLDIRGRGFGLSEVQYSVSEGSGVARDPGLALRLYNKSGLSRTWERDALTLMSPQRLVVPFDLSQPLPPGVYFVELTNGAGAKATSDPVFELGLAENDGGPNDAGFPQADVGPTDGLVPDTGLDGGTPDAADPPDLGFPDTGIVPDSGLGPFLGGYGFRSEVRVSSTVTAETGTTIKVPIAHQALINAGMAQASGVDLALYQGSTLLEFQWDDTVQLGSNNLAMIARLSSPLPPNGDPANPLVLYYGDPAAANTPTDAVFEYVLRFDAAVSPVNSGNGNAWHLADFWGRCDFDRSFAGGAAPFQGAYCDGDFDTFVRSTLGTPRVTTVSSTPPANTVYAASLFMAGRMLDGPADLLYLAYANVNNNFPGGVLLPDAAYSGFIPNSTLTFPESNGNNRTERGWQLNDVDYQDWTRAEVRFVPTIDQPSFQFRYISVDSSYYLNGDSFLAIDDFWIRRALEPDFGVTLGPTETRIP